MIVCENNYLVKGCLWYVHVLFCLFVQCYVFVQERGALRNAAESMYVQKETARCAAF